jgi:hypothetical protein
LARIIQKFFIDKGCLAQGKPLNMSDAAVKQALDTLTNPNATQPEKDKLTNLTKDPKIQDAANKTGISTN